MSVAPEEIARIRSATDLVALIGEHVALRRSGQRWTGLCPFHEEKTPSFSVNQEAGFYYCFGCQKSGDAITFVRDVQHLDFMDALRQLAERANLELHDDAEVPGARQSTKVLYEAMQRAVAWYHERLLTAPDAGRARDYLRSRGYDKEIVEQFQLGWAPDEWDALSTSLRLTPDVATKSGLGFVNKAGRLQDALRARVLFPIFDRAGKPIALGGRILPRPAGSAPDPDGRVEAKYKNTQETAIYPKRKTLYGLNWAKDDVVKADQIVVCEGYTDVIAFFKAGVPRAVATCGTALTEDHFKLMRNFATRIVLAYDADAAGQHAAASVYQWEQQHEVSVAVCELPHGTDPAELERTDPDALGAAVRDAVPFLQFRLDRVLVGADVSSPEGRARSAERALAVIAEHPSELVRDQYVMHVADRCGIDADLLRGSLARRRAGGGPPQRSTRSARPAPEHEGVDRAAVEALRLALHEPEATLPRLRSVLFVDELHRRAYEVLATAPDQAAAIDEAESTGEAEVADLLRRLLVEEPPTPPLGIDPVTAVVAQLVRHAAARVLQARQASVRAGELEAREVVSEISVAKDLLSKLEGPDGVDAEHELVDWLSTEVAA